MKKVASFALGCKVNQYESQAIGELFQKKEYEVVDVAQSADVYVINTCTVTNFGDKKSRQLIRKVKRQNQNAVVVVIGCYAQTSPDEIMAIDGVNLVLGTKDKGKVVDLVENYILKNQESINNNYHNNNYHNNMSEENIFQYSLPESHVSDIMKERVFEPLTIEKIENRTRAYLKIQDGCSQFCSYCIIPYARGPIRSREPKEIIDEVIRLRDNGFKEIVLTGIHLASYGKDKKDYSLTDVIKSVHDVDGIERIRFSSVEPNLMSDDFVDFLKGLNKICHHFHLSLQSGCNKTLKKMNRHYTSEIYLQAVNRLKNAFSDVALTTDIIVGFPDEMEEDFIESYNFAKEIGFSKIHVFPFSPKKGTPASLEENQISSDIKTKRANTLTKLQDTMSKEFMDNQVGKEMLVLVEKSEDNNRDFTCNSNELSKVFIGHSSNYCPVKFLSFENMKNEIINVKITENKGDFLLGEKI